MVTQKRLQKAWNNVKTDLDVAVRNTDTAPQKKRKKNLQRDRDLIDAYLKGLDGDKPGTAVTTKDRAAAETDEGAFSIQEFFKIIGEGARAAQESLDHQSETYIRNRPSFAPETMFRLPKVSANLRLGMKQTKSKEIDFFVFARSGEDSQTIEQEISFEVVAAPPPPDALEMSADLPLGQIVASSVVDRETAITRLKSERARQKRITKKEGVSPTAVTAAEEYVVAAGKMLERDRFRHVLVLQGAGKYVLVFIPPEPERDPQRPDVDVRILTLPKEAGSVTPVETIHLPRTDARMRPLLEVLATPADRQAEILSQLNRT